MPESLPDILYEKMGNIPCVDSPNSMYQIPFYKDGDYFESIESRVTFVNQCEKLIRSNDRYSKYKKYLINVVGLDHSQVIPGCTVTESSREMMIEMHHGPIFTLFDITDIIVEYFLLKKWKITTYRIADYVLEEHYKNRIQIVMLDPSSHQEVHDRSIFINCKQAFGDIVGFIKKHREAISEMYMEKLENYIERSKKYDSNDFGVFELNNAIYPSNY